MYNKNILTSQWLQWLYTFSFKYQLYQFLSLYDFSIASKMLSHSRKIYEYTAVNSSLLLL